MRKHLWLWIVAFSLSGYATAEAQSVTRYATSVARGGLSTGTCLTTGTRCTVKRAVDLSSAGDIVSLESNTIDNPYVYINALDMIVPLANQSGTSDTNRITVRAEVEGGVIIDGNFERTPVNLSSNNDFWLLEGFNARNSGNGLHVVSIGGCNILSPGCTAAQQSSNNLLRGLVLWDAHINSNNNVLGVHGNTGNRGEDLGIFGTGRKLLEASQGGNDFQCRRCWIRHEGSIAGGARSSTFAYKNYDMLCENCIITATGESLPENYRMDGDGLQKTNFSYSGSSNANAYTDRIQDTGTPCSASLPWTCAGGTDASKWSGGSSTGQCSNGRLLGSIAYADNFVTRGVNVYGEAQNDPPTAATTGNWHVTFIRLLDCFQIKDYISVMHPDHPQFTSTQRKALSVSKRGAIAPTEGGNVTHSFLTNVTTVGGTADSGTTGNGWQVSNLIHETTLGALTGAKSPWTGTQGGQVCKRYENGFLTNEPLWPWPMNARILAATGYAGAYNMTTGCVGCLGVSGTGPRTRTATDVTAEIEALLGTIPSACREASGGGFDESVGFPAEAELSTFTNMTGFSTVSGNGATAAGGAASSAGGFTNVKWDTLFEPDHEAWAFVASLPDEGGVMCVSVRLTNAQNRIRACVTRVAGASNDTMDTDQLVGGSVTATTGTIPLELDMAVGDAVGLECAVTTCKMHFHDASDNTTWYEIATLTVTWNPDESYIGFGIATGSLASFGGGGTEIAGGDVVPPNPDPVTGGAATARSQTEIDLTSGFCTDDVGLISYVNYRCTGAACTPTIQIRATDTPDYIDTGLTANTLYRYRVKCSDGVNLSANFSAIFEATTLTDADTTPPGVPGNFLAILAPIQRQIDNDTITLTAAVQLSYTEPTGTDVGTEYIIKRGVVSDCSDCTEICRTVELSALNSSEDSASCLASVAFATTYYYCVSATDLAQNEGDCTSAAGVVIPAAAQFLNTSGRPR